MARHRDRSACDGGKVTDAKLRGRIVVARMERENELEARRVREDGKKFGQACEPIRSGKRRASSTGRGRMQAVYITWLRTLGKLGVKLYPLRTPAATNIL